MREVRQTGLGDDTSLDVLLRILSDGHCHSGEMLSRATGLGRSGLRGYVTRLRDHGLAVKGIRGHGYRAKSFVPIDAYAIESMLAGSACSSAGTIRRIVSTESTNTNLMASCKPGPLPSGTVCIAEWQTDGRGRRGRSWISPPGSALTFSIYWRFARARPVVGPLSLAVGVTVADALESLGYSGIGLKWPNDLIVDGKKLGGILVDMCEGVMDECSVVIGIGLNTDLSGCDLSHIDRQVIDLKVLSHVTGPPDRNRIAATIVAAVRSMMSAYGADDGQSCLDQWRRRDLLLGKNVSIATCHDVVEGVAAGIDRHGRLLIEREGRIWPFSAGDVTVRPRE